MHISDSGLVLLSASSYSFPKNPVYGRLINDDLESGWVVRNPQWNSVDVESTKLEYDRVMRVCLRDPNSIEMTTRVRDYVYIVLDANSSDVEVARMTDALAADVRVKRVQLDGRVVYVYPAEGGLEELLAWVCKHPLVQEVAAKEASGELFMVDPNYTRRLTWVRMDR